MAEKDYIITVFGLVFVTAIIAFLLYTSYRARKGTGFATGYKTKNKYSRSQDYAFTAEDGKIYTATMMSAQAKVTGFLNLVYPDEVQVQYDVNNPGLYNRIVKKKSNRDDFEL